MRSCEAKEFVTAAVLLILAAALGFASVPARAQSNSKPSGDAKHGKQLFLADGCYECHGTVGQGGSAGPRIAPPRLSEEALARYIRQPTGQMPPYTAKVLSDADLADIYAYLKSLPEPAKNIPLLK